MATTIEVTIRDNARQIVDADVESLVQTAKFGASGGLTELVPWVEQTKQLFAKLMTADLSLVGDEKHKRLNASLNTVNQFFQRMRSYSPLQPGSPDRRPSLQREAREAYDNAFNEIAPVLALPGTDPLGEVRSEANRVLTDAKSALTEAQNATTATRTLTTQSEAELKSIIDKTRKVAEEVGIARYATLFQAESEEHRKNSRGWLVGTCGLAAATGVLAYFNYTNTLGLAETYRNGNMTAFTVQLAVAKLIVFSILFSAVLWAGRIYRAHRHNYVVNKHRQNALSTFEVFVKAAEGDDATKNAVLLQATQCIFSPQATGYLSSEKESEGVPQLVEIIRNLPGGKA